MAGWPRLLAHQGGWDEALLFIVPVAVLATLVWIATVAAQRRADGTRATHQADHRRGHPNTP